MGLASKYLNNTRKPTGTLGKVMVSGMNGGHAALASWGSQFVAASPRARILDVGCGGGANIASYLMRCNEGRVDGIDHSEISVSAAQSLNARAIEEGRCAIKQASVDALPFDDASYDLVTAFETVYFWPELATSFAEVFRVLAPGGRFLVVNESTGSDATSVRFSKIIDGMSLYSASELRMLMRQAGFADVTVHEKNDKPWVCVIGTKAGDNESTRLRDAGPDYRNWIPAGMVAGAAGGTAALAAGAAAAGALKAPKAARGVLGAATVVGGAFAAWLAASRERYSYEGARKLSQQIVEGVASHVSLPEGGRCLDVGCGSGALSIAVARRNPQAEVLGVDRWGAEYASYSQSLCEQNAAAEGVANVRFEQGDATALPFKDATFDAVTSNYVYHNVTGANRQTLILETLRCLKKGGSFAIHDIMAPWRFGDMEAFAQSLRDGGYEDVRLIRTDAGLFMEPAEAKLMMLSESTLLVGTK